MSNPRQVFGYANLDADQITIPGDGTTIVPPALGNNGFTPPISAQVGLVASLVNTGQQAPKVGLGTVGKPVIGRIMSVDLDGSVGVMHRGIDYVPFATGALQPVPGFGVEADGAGNVQLAQAQAAINDVQTITGTATGGTYKFSFNGVQQTGTTAFGATAAAVITALQTIPELSGASVVSATGGPLGTSPVVVTFAGSHAGDPMPVITVDNTGATGGTATVAHTTTGQAAILQPTKAVCLGYGVDPTDVSGSQATKCIVKF